MDYVFYLLRSLYRVKWWILLGTALITTFVYFRIGRMQGDYNVESTLYPAFLLPGRVRKDAGRRASEYFPIAGY